jgi:hypothetical protein
MCGEKLPIDLEKRLFESIEASGNGIKNFSYRISDDGKRICLKGVMQTPNFETISEGIDFIEKLLNVKFVNVTNVNGVHTFTYEFCLK